MDSWPLIVAYLYGSIPFSYIIPKLWRGVDITKEGDTNVGATNAAYATNSFAVFVICFLLDATKGLLPALLWGPLAGAFGILGHIFSIYMILFKFKLRRFVVGLGMSATMGFLAVVAPLLIPISLVLFAVYVLAMAPKDVKKWYEEEQGNIETIFALGPATVIYILFFNPDEETKLALLILVLAITFAYARRIRGQLQKCWRCK